MSSLLELALLSLLMGLSIFLSLPLILSRRLKGSGITFLNAGAIGLLVFLLGDIFANVSAQSSSTTLFLTVPTYDVVFAVAVAAAFLVLEFSEHSGPRPANFSPASTALVIALAIGFQNLTEGLVFGSAWQADKIGLITVIFAGFLLQNITEGFPISSPFLGENERRMGLLVALFVLGGMPTLVGAVAGYFYNSNLLDIVFEGLAIGAILYAILPMIRVAFRPAATPEASALKLRLTYLGILLGFLVGFAVNAF
jgi:ZIP family zinc transporter